MAGPQGGQPVARRAPGPLGVRRGAGWRGKGGGCGEWGKTTTTTRERARGGQAQVRAGVTSVGVCGCACSCSWRVALARRAVRASGGRAGRGEPEAAMQGSRRATAALERAQAWRGRAQAVSTRRRPSARVLRAWGRGGVGYEETRVVLRLVRSCRGRRDSAPCGTFPCSMRSVTSSVWIDPSADLTSDSTG